MIRWIFVLIILSLSLGQSFAQDFKALTANELKKMLDSKAKIVIVDAREEVEYREGHIPTAINIPPEKVNVIETFLPKNKKLPIIFYCRGIG
ncbi:MAG: rhodanese-like domain-containing protein [Nitrospirae bacterium]|nr:rhodanese-like domain-containing protein [Nitrospirota bacterium]